jgi:hypothetical protein
MVNASNVTALKPGTPKIGRDWSKITRSGTNESTALPGDGVSCPLEYTSQVERRIFREFQVS